MMSTTNTLELNTTAVTEITKKVVLVQEVLLSYVLSQVTRKYSLLRIRTTMLTTQKPFMKWPKILALVNKLPTDNYGINC